MRVVRLGFLGVASLLVLTAAGCPPSADVQADAPPSGQAPMKPTVVYSSQIGGDDAEFSRDPAPPAARHSGPLSFSEVSKAALAAAEQGQHGTHKGSATTERQPDGSFRYKDFDTAIKCEQLRADAEALVGGCATELYAANCAQTSGLIRPAECTACKALDDADRKIEAAGCPPREQFPTLRER